VAEPVHSTLYDVTCLVYLVKRFFSGCEHSLHAAVLIVVFVRLHCAEAPVLSHRRHTEAAVPEICATCSKAAGQRVTGPCGDHSCWPLQGQARGVFETAALWVAARFRPLRVEWGTSRYGR
jgi:hypothetical protein